MKYSALKFAIPKSFIFITIGVVLLPLVINFFGVNFGNFSSLFKTAAHNAMEVSAISIAALTIILAFVDFRIKGDVSTPIVALALFSSGILDATHLLAANSVILKDYSPTFIIIYTWFISRTFNAFILLCGAGIFLTKSDNLFKNVKKHTLKFFLYTILIFAAITVSLIALLVTDHSEYSSSFESSMIQRRFEIIPLIIYIISLTIIFPKFYSNHPSIFSQTLLLSFIPAIAAQLHMLFGSKITGDNHFFIAHYDKIISYLVPFIGITLNYQQTFNNEKRAAAAMRSESEEKNKTRMLLEGVMNASLNGILTYSSVRDTHKKIIDFKCIMANPSAKKILNDDRLNTEYFSNSFSHDNTFIKAFIDVANGNVQTFEQEFYSEALKKWLHVSAVKFEDGFTKTIADITLRKTNEVKLQMREALLGQAHEMAKMGSWEWELASNEITWSDQMWRLYGYKPNEFPIDVIQNMLNIHPDDSAKVYDLVKSFQNEPQAFSIEYRRFNKNEELMYIHSEGIPIKDANGKVTKMIGINMDITERKIAENQLRESEQFNRSISELAPNLVYIYKLENYKLIYLNQKMTEILGYDIHEMIGSEEDLVAKIIYPADQKKLFDNSIILKNLKDGEILKSELRMYHKDGRLLNIALSESVFKRNELGEVESVIGLANDNTHEQKMLEALQKREAMLSETEKLAHIGSWEWDVTENKVTWSDEIFRMHGYSPRAFDVTYEKFMEHVHEEDKIHAQEMVMRTLKTGSDLNYEYKIIDAHGKVKHLMGRGVVVKNEIGEIIKISGSSMDITFEKIAREELERSEILYRALARNMPQSEVLLYDKNLKVILADGNISNDLIKNKNKLVGIDMKDIIRQYEFSAFENNLLTPEIIHLEKQQNDRYYNVQILPVTKGGNELVAGMLLIQDVTDLKLSEFELENKIEALNKSNAELEQFAYVASHDLQEPLRKITSFGDRLQSKYKNLIPEDGKVYIERMFDASIRMQTLINDLLSFSRVAKVSETFEKIDLNQLFKTIMSDMEISLKQSEAKIKVGELPVVEGLNIQLQRLFQNLISNAIKFKKDNVKPVVTIKSAIVTAKDEGLKTNSPHKKFAKIIVEDNGIGFEEEFANKIFIIFQRLHGRSEFEGTGIGLSICKKIVENHNGKIYAKGNLGSGAIFTILLPLNQNHS